MQTITELFIDKVNTITTPITKAEYDVGYIGVSIYRNGKLSRCIAEESIIYHYDVVLSHIMEEIANADRDA